MELLMLVGLPGSGKTTYRRKNTSQCALFSPDDNLTSNEKYVWTPERSEIAWAQAYWAFGDWIGQEKFFSLGCWDACFPDRRSRSAILNIARGARVHVTGVHLATPMDVCRSRNKSRAENRRVPEEAFDRMAARFQPPTKEEGFDRIITVTG